MMKISCLRYGSNQKKRRGSAMLGVLIMTGILSMVVLAVLGTANHNTRMTRDQLEYEAAYMAALSGVHTGRAIVNHPTMLLTMLGKANLDKDVSELLNLGENLTETVNGLGGVMSDLLELKVGSAVKGLDPATGGLLERHGLGNLLEHLDDGRIVLIDVPRTNGKVLGFVNSHGEQFDESLYSGDSETGFESYVDRLRITLELGDPIRGLLNGSLAGNVADLSILDNVGIIIEARGVVDTGGRRKERVVQERLVLLPEVDKLAGSAAAMLVDGNMTLRGGNSFDLNWGPVQTKGSIEVSGLKYEPSRPGRWGGLLNLTWYPPKPATLTADDSYQGAGTWSNVRDTSGNPIAEKWMKWQSAGALLTNVTPEEPTGGAGGLLENLLGGLIDVVNGIAGIVVDGVLKPLLFPGSDSSDFFADMVGSNLKLAGAFIPKNMNKGHEYGLYDLNDEGTAVDGALVQGSEAVATIVDDFFSQPEKYAYWKNMAIAQNTYIKPLPNKAGGATYGNEFNQPLYLDAGGLLTTKDTGNPLDSLSKLSMKDQLQAANGQVHRLSDPRVDDNLLFIDYISGTIENPGPEQDHVFDKGFFWKGIVFVNGNVVVDGSQSPGIIAKTPEQFEEDPYGPTGVELSHVILDGILYSTGTVSDVFQNSSGILNSVIYGTVGSMGSITSDMAPSVFFNSSNLLGRLGLPVKAELEAKVMFGRTYEVDRYIE